VIKFYLNIYDNDIHVFSVAEIKRK